MKLLLVEDNASMRTSLQRTLQRCGMQVFTCDNGRAALEQWQACRPDVVLLDLSLPERDGLEVLTDARQAGLRTPVIILTARGTVGDRIIGLNTGADDYLPKPFDLDELEARVRALARRSSGQPDALATSQTQSWCGMRIDAESGAAYHDGLAMELAPRELAMLRAVLARPGQAISKERLFDQVFPGEAHVQHEAIEVVAYRLRKKIAHTGAQLVTLRGLGYLLRTAS